MAIGVMLDFPEGTLDQYDQAIGKMGLKLGGPMPDGGMFHWVTPTDDGIRVTDVWESREKFEKFANEQIGPITQEVGMNEPQMSFFEVHNYLIAS